MTYVCGKCLRTFPTAMAAWCHYYLVVCYRRVR